MSTPKKTDIDPQRLGVALIIAFVLFLMLGALPGMVYSREPGEGIGGLISLGVMGAIGIAPGWATHRMRKNGRPRWSAFLLPVASLCALVVMFSMLEISQVISTGGVMGLFPVSFLLGIFCIPLSLIACGIAAAATEPAKNEGAPTQPAGDDSGKQAK